MFGSYLWLMEIELKQQVVKETLQKLLNEGRYPYNVLRSFIILGDTFYSTTDKRKLRRAKRILRANNVKFAEIKKIVDEAWEKEKVIYNEVQKVMFDKVGFPRLAHLMWT